MNGKQSLAPRHIVSLLLRAYREEAPGRDATGDGPLVVRLEPDTEAQVPADAVTLELGRELQDAAQAACEEELTAAGLSDLAERFFARFDEAGVSAHDMVRVPGHGVYHVDRPPAEGRPPAGGGTAGGATSWSAAAAGAPGWGPASADGCSVEGKTVVVTGGAQGFGALISAGLVARGGHVFVSDIDEEAARSKAGELNEKARSGGGGAADSVAVDVSDEASVAGLVSGVVERTGRLDVFISNAGVLRAGSVLTLPAKHFEMVTSVNYRGFFYCAKHAARAMAVQNHALAVRRRGEDSGPACYSDIIQINSKSGLTGSKKNGAYAGSKFGGVGLTQSFALELVEHYVKVNAVCPGNFFEGALWSDPENGLFVQYLKAGKVPGAKTIDDVRRAYEAKVPMGRGCRGDDVIRAIVYLIDQDYETGQAVPVTGGQTMLS